MKKQNLLSGALCALLLSLSACSNEDELQAGISTEDVNSITMTATDFEYPITRTDFGIGSSGAAFKWAANDTVGIFPNEGSQVYFPMTSGAGTNSATFTGGGWALKSSATYAAYYPFIGNMYLDQTKIPVSYTGQTQTGNGSTAHLGAYDFMAASATTAENGGVNFTFKHLGCLVQLKITVPNAGTLSSVTLSADEEFFVEKGYIDLTTATPTIVSTQTASSLNIDLKDVTTTATNEVVTVYFMMAPVDMTGKTLTVKVGNAEGTMDAKNFEEGTAYQMTASLIPSGPIAVDLGLSVKWASYNVGAESPEEYGGYYAWGETEEKEIYSWETYKWCNGTEQSWTKYNKYDTYAPVVDNKTVLDPEDDVAHVKWGGSWRMPTRKEIEELVNNCSWTWTIQNGVNGQLATGPNGNSIFLPATGNAFRDSTPPTPGSDGRYLSAELTQSSSSGVGNLYFLDYNPDEAYFSSSNRYTGHSVRPVTE
ncbi:MAG: fimbrillin family protein [Bacteroidaceae bacterium]|nr:fimbrillin family protein [Bacteroidaceae bacterium]